MAEHEGLLSGDSSNEDVDKGDEIEEVTDFDQGLPLSLQVNVTTTNFHIKALEVLLFVLN